MKLVLFGIMYVLMISVTLIIGGGNHRMLVQYNSISEKEEKIITFEKDIKPIMNTNCGGVFCHHGKPSTWTNYEFVKRSIDNGTFRERVIVKKDMPKRKPLSIVDYNLINDWLKNGAIEK